MRKSAALWTLLIIFGLFASGTSLWAQGPAHYAKNIIFMVPDGMGLADVTAARIKINGIGGAPLYLERLDHVGYERNYSEDATVTDSAAAASAFACGEKFKNGEVCLHNDRPNNPSILELAKARGMLTGLVATSTITHATPAAFGSHVPNRDCETTIARQYIEQSQPDVILGGGQDVFIAGSDDCGTAGNLIAEAQSKGYRYVTTKDEMDAAVASRITRLLGLFNPDALTPEYQRTSPMTEPRLPDMAAAALKMLDRKGAGFFLFIEGSQIDWGNHEENFDYQLGEMRAFNETVKVVLDWINASAERRAHTLLIIAPDHETGGFGIKPDYDSSVPGPFKPGWVYDLATEGEADHTGMDVMIWSQGPGSEALAKAGLDNTDPYKVMKAALRF